jgi:hypothetical protein
MASTPLMLQNCSVPFTRLPNRFTPDDPAVGLLHPRALERGEQPALATERELQRGPAADSQEPWPGELQPPVPHNAEPAQNETSAKVGIATSEKSAVGTTTIS